MGEGGDGDGCIYGKGIRCMIGINVGWDID